MEQDPSELTAIVLAGGLGTRLRPITEKVPKPLVMVKGRPFLDYLLEKIARMGLRRCVLLVGYKGGMIEDYCGGGKKWGLKISYSHEKEQLGTGGALVNAVAHLHSAALVLNGDSYLDIDARAFYAFHCKRGALATVYAMQGALEARGEVVADEAGCVEAFREKQGSGFGLFNTGAYIIEKQAVEFLAQQVEEGALPAAFSMERDGFPLFVKKGWLFAHVGTGKFLDIGTFKSLEEAGEMLP
ncbi:MAG: sugar phosphate nucleotidyltransferase [Candidatus Micrarchaeota archaeon]|nr:sugar phosphate nucleotidyltransferase [Candidatus Micrarchaeota archaeon]